MINDGFEKNVFCQSIELAKVCHVLHSSFLRLILLFITVDRFENHGREIEALFVRE